MPVDDHSEIDMSLNMAGLVMLASLLAMFAAAGAFVGLVYLIVWLV